MTGEAGAGAAGPVMDPAATTKRAPSRAALGDGDRGTWGAVPVTAVDIGVQDTWQRAELEPRSGGDFAWQQFSAGRRFGPGDYRILARAASPATPPVSSTARTGEQDVIIGQYSPLPQGWWGRWLLRG